MHSLQSDSVFVVVILPLGTLHSQILYLRLSSLHSLALTYGRYAVATRSLPHVKPVCSVVMAADWGANTQACPPHLASIVTVVEREGAEGRRRGKGRFQMFLPIWEYEFKF